MTWGNRFRLFIGVIVVLGIVAGLTLVLSVRETEVASSSASIKAISYSVGSDFAGTVVDEKIKVGDTVKKGKPLMTIQSVALATATQEKGAIPTSSAYTVAPGGLLTLTATRAGVVGSVGANVGGFVNAGSQLASIDEANSLYVLAYFHINAYDFSRTRKGARVDLMLPNQQQVTGSVSELSVTTSASGTARVRVLVKCPQLVLGHDGGLMSPGTPIIATLRLRDSGPLGGVREMFAGLMERMHL